MGSLGYKITSSRYSKSQYLDRSPAEKYAYVKEAIDKIYDSEIKKLNPRDPSYSKQIEMIRTKCAITLKDMVKTIQAIFGDPSEASLFDEKGKAVSRTH